MGVFILTARIFSRMCDKAWQNYRPNCKLFSEKREDRYLYPDPIKSFSLDSLMYTNTYQAKKNYIIQTATITQTANTY